MKTLFFTTITTVLLSLNSLASDWSPGQWHTYRSGNVDAYVYVPAAHRTRTTSMMLSLHGCAQKAEDLMKAGNWEEAANQYDMVVVLPKVPGGGKYAGCWDYYGPGHRETNRDNVALINLTIGLLNTAELEINPNRVYISGLSAGATEALVMSCLRPDLFAGVAVNAGPAIGTGVTDLHQPPTSPANALHLCQNLAGSRQADFATQLASLILDPKDPVVSPGHSAINAQMLSALYGAETKESVDMASLPGTNTKGAATLWIDSQNQARVLLIANEGLGHAWPAGANPAKEGGNGNNGGGNNGGNRPGNGSGSGNGGHRPGNGNLPGNGIAAPQLPIAPMFTPILFRGGFISANSVNYPMILGKYFSENNLRD